MDYRSAFSEIIAELDAAGRPEFLRRHLRYEVLPRKAVVLKGVRRSGKSTLLLQIEEAERQERRECLTMNFIDERLTQLQGADLGQMFDAYYQTHDAAAQRKLSLLLDEIQVVDGWEAFVERQLRIHNRRVFLTGSSAKLLSKEIASSMRGRSLAYEVFPFDFGEYLALQQRRPAQALGQEEKGIIKAQFQRYLTEGGFPETVGRQAATRTRILQEYFDVL